VRHIKTGNYYGTSNTPDGTYDNLELAVKVCRILNEELSDGKEWEVIVLD
jgi:hypothetical protein